MVLNRGSKTKNQKYCGRDVASLFLFKSFWKSIRSLRDCIFIPSHAVSLDPLHKTSLTTQKGNGKKTELTQCQPLEFPLFEWWPGQVLLSVPKNNWATFSFVSRGRFNFKEGSYFWEKQNISLFFLLIVPFNRDWVQYLFMAYLSSQISARHPHYVLIAFE